MGGFGPSQTTTSNAQTNSNSTLSSILNSLSNSNSNSTSTPNENPLFKSFRESILPAISQQYADAQAPVYGDAQKAQAITDANNIYDTGQNGLTGAAAKRGILNSGATQAASNSMGQQRAGGITSFFNQIPQLNSQAKFDRTQGLLGLATSFLGNSPIGQTNTGSQQSSTNSTQNQTGTQNSTSSGTQKQSSNPGWGSIIGNIAGGLLGGL